MNIASGVGLMPTGPGSVAYVASKGGVVALTKSVAMELAPNIRVNSVCPGSAKTAMTASRSTGRIRISDFRQHHLTCEGQPVHTKGVP
jgi:NAD(P)-dependent dehydrogenase (short-subunit alcohol dehydrogenase family)